MDSYSKELLLIQLAHAKQATSRARNNRYSDLKKQLYQDTLLALFDKVEAHVNTDLDRLTDAQIYDGPKKHLDFIFKSLEFLDNSTLNQIPYEIVACLEQAMEDWLDKNNPADRFIIVTSLINDVGGFSYERWLAIDDALYRDIEAQYPDIFFRHRLVQINLPRAFARDYLATVVLYHELGHFIDHKHSIAHKLYLSLLISIQGSLLSEEILTALKAYLPGLSVYIQDSQRKDWRTAKEELSMSWRHLQEYFCDWFAAQYIGPSANLYVSYLAQSGATYNETHPSAINRQRLVNDYLNGRNNVIIDLINGALCEMGRPLLERKYELPNIDDFFDLIPPHISSTAQLHGILNGAWEVWLNKRPLMLSRLNTQDSVKVYLAINNLVEKAIGNYIVEKEWYKVQDDISEPLVQSGSPIVATVENYSKRGSGGILVKNDLLTAIQDKTLVIRPLLSPSQISEVSIDFRLGYDFLVSVQGRDAFINASKNSWTGQGSEQNVRHFFQSTRRQIGETFILHPNQTVLAVTLEYVKLPENCLLELFMRSSYARLGITINTIAQPGYAGCLNMELTNTNNNPINLTVGARIIQGVFHKLSQSLTYFHTTRKYVCQVRPEPSAIVADNDLNLLHRLWKHNNHREERDQNIH